MDLSIRTNLSKGGPDATSRCRHVACLAAGEIGLEGFDQVGVLAQLAAFAGLDEFIAVGKIGGVVIGSGQPFLLLLGGQCARRQLIAALERFNEVIREFLLTVNIEMVKVVEIRFFVQIGLVVGLLKIQIIKAVFTNDVADGVCALKACPGAAHDDMRKAHKYHVGEVFVAAELQQLAQASESFMERCVL